MKKHRILLGMLAVLSLLLLSGVFAQQPAPLEHSTSARQSAQSPPSASGPPPDALTAVQGLLLSTEALLGSDANLGPLKEFLIRRTEGNPVFLEESVRTLV